jgi:putative ABC transport system permease protein
MTRDRLHRASERWFRLLLRLYPAAFRDEMGNAVVDAYCRRADQARARGGVIRLARVWLAALGDALRNGPGERVRPAASWRRRGGWGRDLEFARRRLARSPLFAVATVATLTVGLGAFAVIFTAVDKILLEPLPYKNPGDLYRVWATVPHLDVREGTLSGPQLAEIQTAGGVIADAAGFQCGNGAIPAGNNTDAYHINMMAASGNLFDLLGAHAALGRGFRPDEGGQGHPTTMVLSDAMWKRLGANPAIIGTPLRVGPDTHTVVGVMRSDFVFSCSASQTPDVYIPYAAEPAKQNPNNYPHQILVRARPGTSAAAVREAVDAAARRIVERIPMSRGMTLYAVGVHADLVKQVRPALVALGVAATFLLLVLTVNLASLLLARAARREREFAISRALGASSAAVARATTFEGALLGLFGGVAATIAGGWGTRLLVALGPSDLPRRGTIVLDWSVAAVVVAVGALLGVIAATAPAAWAARLSSASLMSTAAVHGAAGPRRLRRSLIVVQVALSLVLLSAGGLVVRSFERLVAADPGFQSEGVLTLRLSTIVFTENRDALSFLDRTTEALRAIPGVTGVSATSSLPLSGLTAMQVVAFPAAPGNTGERDKDRPLVDTLRVRAGYVETLKMRLLSGRTFEANRRDGVREALIDRHLAQQFFPGRSPLGATLQFNDNAITIVGVVDQARQHNLHRDGRQQVFLRAEDYGSRGYWFFTIHTQREPTALIPDVRGAIRTIERRVPVSQMRPLDEIVAEARSRERISAALIAGLAIGALLLAAMGLFGMITGSVTRRRGELAVRLALGATYAHVLRLVVGEGVLLVGTGVLIGLPGIYATGDVIRGLLIDVSPWDPPTLLVVTTGFAMVTIAACYVPARRVLRLDPAPLLRPE